MRCDASTSSRTRLAQTDVGQEDPRALSASATSVSSPTDGAPPCSHGASPHSTPLHRKTNRNLRPPLLRTGYGAVPSAADRWPSSNDSPPHNSNSVLHRSWPRLYEITRPHTARSRVSVPLADVCLPYPQTSSSCPRLGSLRPSARLCTRCAGCYSSSPDDSRELLHPSLAPFNLHKSRVRRASGFLLTAFSNATPHTFFQPSALPASRLKKH